MEVFSWITTLLTQLFPSVSRDSKIRYLENFLRLLCSLYDLGWSQSQDKTARLWCKLIKIISFLQTKMRGKKNTLWIISEYCYEAEYQFSKIFFSLAKQHCFCIHIFYLFGFCIDVISQLPVSIAFFLCGQKSWIFFKWKRMVDILNSVCFSNLEINSKTAYTFCIEKCGFWKA